MGPRTAILEFNAYHEEVIPTFVHLLNRVGVEPRVYLVRRSRRRKPFDLAPELRFGRSSIEAIDERWGIPFRARLHQLLIINSMEPAANLERISGARTPLLGVMHNAELLHTATAYRTFFAQRRRLPVVLGRHIAAHLEPTIGPVPWVSHVYFGPPPPRPVGRGPTTFAVSGNVEFHRRNYLALLDAAEQLHREGRALRVRVIGRSHTPDGERLREELARRGLGDLFEFSAGEVSHPEFIGQLAASDFVLPLIDEGSDRFRAYLETKVASSIPFAIGLGVPIVMHRALTSVYGLDGAGPTHGDGELAAAMRRAIESGVGDRAGWTAAIGTIQASILDASLESLRGAIARVRR